MSGYRELMLSCMIALELLVSCTSGRGDALPTYPVIRMAYEDVLVMEGHTESVNSINIHCPPNVGGTIVHIVESGTEVKKGDVICVIEDDNLAQEYERLTLDLEAALAEIDKLHASQHLEYALLEAQVKNNEAETILASSDSLQMLYMSPTERRTKALELERAGIERVRLLKKLEAIKGIQEIDVVRVEKRIERLKRRLEGERKKMESLTLHAPQDGLAVRARRFPWSDERWKVGDHVDNGRILVTLPDFDQLKVLFYLPETEYKRLQLGDSVMYTFDALPGNRAWGRITKMASVGQTRIEGSQVKTFEIEASVDSLLMPAEPRLSTQCHIYLRHIPDTIVVPTIAIFDKDSLKVVYVKQGRKYEERLVTLGTGSTKMTIIAHGLHEGEQIALIRPGRNNH
ncbi:MAG: efflux RND transporter periplasmic adaptor subunit [Bacteroidaceae bacterium]|nr:efflux RND transporter periplasmic adaptor subunit [Bacteroidaceae bacterium]